MIKLSNIILKILYIIITIFFIVYLTLPLFGYRVCQVPTGSMIPTIQIGSLTLIDENVTVDDVSVGNIIVFQRDDGMKIIHRVIEITDDGIYTKGDANTIPDNICITSGNFIGLCVFDSYYLGIFLDFITSITGKAFYIFTLLGSWFLSAYLMRREKEC